MQIEFLILLYNPPHQLVWGLSLQHYSIALPPVMIQAAIAATVNAPV